MQLEGLNDVVRNLQQLRDVGANKAAMDAARAAAKEFEKGIKDAIPGQYKSARKAIGRRVRKRKGEVTAKVGAGVGKQSTNNKHRKRSGVGLGKRNIHWAILGVQPRQTKTGKNRGRHDGFLRGIVQQGASTAEIRAAVEMRRAAQAALEKSLR